MDDRGVSDDERQHFEPGLATRVAGITTPTWRNHAAAAPTTPDDLYCLLAATVETTGYTASTAA